MILNVKKMRQTVAMQIGRKTKQKIAYHKLVT
jgi:hypothetical protein